MDKKTERRLAKYHSLPPLTPHKPDTELEKLLAKASKKSMNDAEIAAQRRSLRMATHP